MTPLGNIQYTHSFMDEKSCFMYQLSCRGLQIIDNRYASCVLFKIHALSDLFNTACVVHCSPKLFPVSNASCLLVSISIYFLVATCRLLSFKFIYNHGQKSLEHSAHLNMAIAVFHPKNDIIFFITLSPPSPRQCWKVSSTLAMQIQHSLGEGRGVWLGGGNMGILLKQTYRKYIKSTKCPKTSVHDCRTNNTSVVVGIFSPNNILFPFCCSSWGKDTLEMTSSPLSSKNLEHFHSHQRTSDHIFSMFLL